MDDHPGGKGFLRASVGRDVTASFNGGVYDHANAARNLMQSMRYARLDGKVPETAVAKED
jgi:stearoyl-CoA desaturase (delta-9 desaturase)